MKVFKFGGASVKDADAVKNAAAILKSFKNENISVVISAMGKTTNALEKITAAYINKDGTAAQHLEELKNFHYNIMDQLFPDRKHEVFEKVNNYFVEIEWVLEEEPREYDFVYDQIVSTGELISSTIVSGWLDHEKIEHTWIDIRDYLITDNRYREGNVNWEKSAGLVNEGLKPLFQGEGKLIITQGFIASTDENYTTTLGREGSDYTAAILAYLLDAESVTIWKDVPGVLNADPKYFPDAQKLEQLSYLDAIEMAYYGASVIHPKTIKPLENKSIPLYVRSFVNPEYKGTMIAKDVQTKPLIPSFIFKTEQVLISISARDFSFIAEENLSDIFSAFAEAGLKLNLMQNSAISFSVCLDADERIEPMIRKLQTVYRVKYNVGLELYTIRHYYASTIDQLSQGKEVLLEQRSRHTAQLVMKPELTN